MSESGPTPPDGVVKLGMPKWGLSMTEGRVLDWLVDEGEDVTPGQGLAEVESEKINGEVEAPADGVLARQVGAVGSVVPVGGLLGVIASTDVDDAVIDEYIAVFQASFVPEEEAEAAGPEPATVDAAGLKVRYLEMGDGDETVVLLHGFGGDLNNWLFTQPAVAERRRVLALDLPGHGQTTKDVGDGSLSHLADVVASALDAVDTSDVHLVGHSMGGGVATLVAERQPGRVRSLALIAPTGLGRQINASFINGFIDANRRREMKEVLGLLFADPDMVTRRIVADVLAFKRFDGVNGALRTIADRQFGGGAQTEDVIEHVGAAGVPTLVIWGAQDRILPVDQARVLGDTARVEVLDEAGHSPHMERAGDVHRLLEEFWDRAV